MKKILSAIVVFGVLLSAVSVAHARDDKQLLSIAEALEVKDSTEKLDDSVKFYFGDQEHPKVLSKLGSDFTNRKTNAFGKSSEKACHWAFLSAMVALQDHAHEVGANAVINIVSYYKKNVMSSPTEFECHAGGFIAGVALKGEFVKIGAK